MAEPTWDIVSEPFTSHDAWMRGDTGGGTYATTVHEGSSCVRFDVSYTAGAGCYIWQTGYAAFSGNCTVKTVFKLDTVTQATHETGNTPLVTYWRDEGAGTSPNDFQVGFMPMGLSTQDKDEGYVRLPSAASNFFGHCFMELATSKWHTMWTVCSTTYMTVWLDGRQVAYRVGPAGPRTDYHCTMMGIAVDSPPAGTSKVYVSFVGISATKKAPEDTLLKVNTQDIAAHTVYEAPFGTYATASCLTAAGGAVRIQASGETLSMPIVTTAHTGASHLRFYESGAVKAFQDGGAF